jgi:hypothetical protein
MAALHEAQDRGAPDRLELVERIAAIQQRTIDESAPTHPLSSISARRHGKVGEGIYTVAARATLARRRLEAHKG